MDPKVIIDVKHCHKDFLDAFLQPNARRIRVKLSDDGLEFLGTQLRWEDITDVHIKFFHGNPYVQLRTTQGEPNKVVSLYFPTKWYHQRREPWHGASQFLTEEFTKVLEEQTGKVTVQGLREAVQANTATPPLYKLWNITYWTVPALFVLLTIVVIVVGLTMGGNPLPI